MRPQVTPGDIIDIDSNIQRTVSTVVDNAERCLGRRRIGRAVHIAEYRFYTLYHIECQFSCRRVVHHVPGTEQQVVLAIVQCRDAVTQFATGITAEVILEIVVQRVCLAHLSVDNQLQVMTNTAACRIDAVLIGQFCHEIRRCVHVAAIDECRAVQITVDAGTLLIATALAGAVHDQLFETTGGCDGLGVVDSKEVDDALLVGVCDVLGYHKGKGEASLSHAVVSVKDGARPVIVDERLVSFRCVVHLTYNLFFCIAHHCIDGAIETAVCHEAVVQHTSANRCRCTSFQGQYVVTNRCVVDTVNDNRGSG